MADRTLVFLYVCEFWKLPAAESAADEARSDPKRCRGRAGGSHRDIDASSRQSPSVTRLVQIRARVPGVSLLCVSALWCAGR